MSWKASCHSDEQERWCRDIHYPTQTSEDTQRTTNAFYVDARTPILLQTAKLRLYNLNDVIFPPDSVKVRAIMDSRSQRTYVTTHVKESLHLPSKRTECLHIKTFGSTEERETAVELGLVTSNGERLKLSALAVPFICDPVASQPISYRIRSIRRRSRIVAALE